MTIAEPTIGSRERPRRFPVILTTAVTQEVADGFEQMSRDNPDLSASDHARAAFRFYLRANGYLKGRNGGDHGSG
jgi:hypothetical protein